MPQSLLINLVPEAAIPPKYLESQHLKRLFFALVSAADAELGHILQADSQNKAFTLSPLQFDPQRHRLSPRNLRFLSPPAIAPLCYRPTVEIPAGVHCWWRISFLDDALFSAVGPAWEQQLAAKGWFLGPVKLQITNLLRRSQQPFDWASAHTYQQLYEQASASQRQIQFQLMTPTVFRQGGYSSPMPTRDAVFHSLRKRWNRFSGLAFAPSIVNPIVPAEFDLRTELLETAQEKVIGAVGQLTFQVLGEVDPLTLKRINTLADFACYAGVGRRQTDGLGLTRRLLSAGVKASK